MKYLLLETEKRLASMHGVRALVFALAFVLARAAHSTHGGPS